MRTRAHPRLDRRWPRLRVGQQQNRLRGRFGPRHVRAAGDRVAPREADHLDFRGDGVVGGAVCVWRSVHVGRG